MATREKVSVGILGVGNYVPKKILNNFDLEKMVDTSDEWITKRTGISERRILEEDKPLYYMGVEAAKQALEDANLDASEIDLVLVTSSTPDYLTPSTSCLIQGHIGAVNAAAFDIVAACSGFVYGLTVAQQFIETGYYKHILLVSNEGMTRALDWKDRNSCILFGDGAGAAVIGRVEDGYGIISTYIGADGSMGDKITIPCLYMPEEDVKRREGMDNKMSLWQDGQEVFKFAVKIMPYASEVVLKKAGMSIDDVKYIIPHQANIRIIDSAAKRLGVAFEKVYTTIKKFGNISSASIPVAMAEAYKKKFINKGDNLLLVGFGGGLTWASALIKWSK